MSVFDRFTGYGFIHHRALNAPQALAEALAAVRAHPGETHILEGDICWDFSDGRALFYFRHPAAVFDTLSPETVRAQVARGQRLDLDSLAALRDTGAFLAIELKVGRGDWKAALRALIGQLERDFSGRYWIDGFSLTMLEYVKVISPHTSVTLHSECVTGTHVVIGAPEWPPLRIARLDALPQIDGIAIRRHGPEAFMARACAGVHRAGKALVISRLFTLHQFECSRRWGAHAGYMHWDFDALVDFNKQIEAKGIAPPSKLGA